MYVADTLHSWLELHITFLLYKCCITNRFLPLVPDFTYRAQQEQEQREAERQQKQKETGKKSKKKNAKAKKKAAVAKPSTLSSNEQNDAPSPESKETENTDLKTDDVGPLAVIAKAEASFSAALTLDDQIVRALEGETVKYPSYIV